jgi:hypothetical protein
MQLQKGHGITFADLDNGGDQDVDRSRQREVIALAKIAGLSRAEIGERMGRSETAVRTLLHRALADLAERLGGNVA